VSSDEFYYDADMPPVTTTAQQMQQQQHNPIKTNNPNADNTIIKYIKIIVPRVLQVLIAFHNLFYFLLIFYK